MKEKILAYIAEHPGCRKREIAYALHIWQCDGSFLRTMRELEMVDNLIYYVIYQDTANMEYYDKWYLVKKTP